VSFELLIWIVVCMLVDVRNMFVFESRRAKMLKDDGWRDVKN